MPLSGPQAEALHRAILDAFSQPELEQLLRHKLNQRLDEIAARGSLSETAHAVVDWADRRGRIPGLVVAILEERPNKPLVLAAVRELLSAPPAPAVAAQGPVLLTEDESRICTLDQMLRNPTLGRFRTITTLASAIDDNTEGHSLTRSLLRTMGARRNTRGKDLWTMAKYWEKNATGEWVLRAGVEPGTI
jgi:hypothetical protein